MKVMLLAGASAIHTQRWANGLVAAGVDVVCVSLHPFMAAPWDPRVVCVALGGRPAWGYVSQGRTVARLFEAHRCDVLNAHYASGYGLLALRSKVHPSLLSVWGSDVHDFPAKSRLHRALIRRTLMAADRVASTSHAMARQVEAVLGGGPSALRQPIAITPFGVDTQRFAPAHPSLPDSGMRPIVLGTVKTLEPKYGIDTLLRAFARLRAPQGGVLPHLRIAGQGGERQRLQALAAALGVADRVAWLGAVPHTQVPDVLHRLDVFVAASRLDSESFGVAVIEASACELPVVVTDVGGLPEVVVNLSGAGAHGEKGASQAAATTHSPATPTGIVVPRENPDALAQALQRLVDDPSLRRQLGQAGRLRVQSHYEWHDNVQHMISVYQSVVAAAAKPHEGRTS